MHERRCGMGKIRGKIQNSFGIGLDGSKFLGRGHSGSVYLMPNGNVIKIFKSEESCINEYLILQSVRGNAHFPTAHECRGNCMIREYVPGICVTEYIKAHGLTKKLALNLISLIEDFKRLGFKKLDMRCSHIFVQPDESVRVIDPRNHYTQYTPYPAHLFRNLKGLKVFDQFSAILKDYSPDLYNSWIIIT